MGQPIPNDNDTERLLEEAKGGDDHKAFDDLFSRHRDYLCKVVALRLDPRIKSRIDPSDVVQEAQMEAFRRFDDYLVRRPMPFRLWLRKTTCERLLVLQRYHRANRRNVERDVGIPDRSAFALVEQLIGSGSAPSRRLERSETTRRVRQVLAQLSEPDREILLMRNLEGLSNQEVAEVLDIEPAAASQRYGRALLRLRKLLIDNALMGSQ